MKCIFCHQVQTSVVNSRPTREGVDTWRRRQCSACNRLFTTRESALTDNLFVEKRNGRRQRFVYEKFFASVFAALNARKDRDNGEDAITARRMCHQVIDDVFSRFITKKSIPTRTLILLTYTRLRELNTAFAERYIYYSEHRLKVARGTRS